MQQAEISFLSSGTLYHPHCFLAIAHISDFSGCKKGGGMKTALEVLVAHAVGTILEDVTL